MVVYSVRKTLLTTNEFVNYAHADHFSQDSLASEGNKTLCEDIISFSDVDIITPSQKLLARRLTCEIVPGKSLLVTG